VSSPGTILGDSYELLELLGRGGMGEVWRARHLRLPKEVAIKLLHSCLEQSPEMLARFRREAEVTSRLGHPHIIEVLDYNVLPDGRAYLVMELLEGMTLRQRLAKGPLSVEETLSILAQVASALQAAHGAGVVHRDLNPSNIFLTWRPAVAGDELCVKVLDFGISKIQGASTLVTSSDSVLGTPAYMSPEQAGGHSAEVDGRADQFALAVVGYELLSGQRAFTGRSMAELIHRVVYEESPSLRQVRRDLPEHLTAAIERGMAKDPRRRYPEIGAFLAAVMGAPTADPPDETHAPVTVATPTRARRQGAHALSSSRARRRWPWLVGPLVLVLAAGGGVVWWSQGPGPGGSAGRADAGAPASDGRSPDRRPPDGRSLDGRPPDGRPPDGRPPDGRSPDGRSPLDARGPETPRPAPGAKPPRRAPRAEAPVHNPDLEAARAALSSGDFDEALRRSARALYACKDDASASSQVFALRASAYCGKHDLGNAKAMLRQVLAPHRRGVRAFCARFDQPL